ncbi:hypothetical protein [Agrobacterium larrymoorei]|uniref:hypothetical protein n=1 Tax=Agrobacterium larrymoorei TaxID=160699 RepID=UPI0027D800C5|nr:hypothetical protein [Agrobacterium larrymoorei]
MAASDLTVLSDEHDRADETIIGDGAADGSVDPGFERSRMTHRGCSYIITMIAP